MSLPRASSVELPVAGLDHAGIGVGAFAAPGEVMERRQRTSGIEFEDGAAP